MLGWKWVFVFFAYFIFYLCVTTNSCAPENERLEPENAKHIDPNQQIAGFPINVIQGIQSLEIWVL